MAQNKGLCIDEIRDGQAVRGFFLVRQMTLGETKAGKAYLSLTLMDRTGEMAARVWDNANALAKECPVGAIIEIDAQAQAYRNILQLKINDLRGAPPGKSDPAQFMPATPADIPALQDELRHIIKTTQNHQLQTLLEKIFSDQQLFSQFSQAPAAKNMHHAYIGGLLEHTVAVARLADLICTLYPAMDRSLLVTGALLHDIGKVREFSFEVFPFDYSDQGRLIGHLVLGVEMAGEAIATLKDFPADLAERLKHLILSHHGRHEFGSPALPMTIEAFVLNLLDDLDAKANYVDRLSGQAKDKTGYHWTDFQRTMERFLFVRGHAAQEKTDDRPPEKQPPAVPEPTAEHGQTSRRQPSLWDQ